MFQYFSGVADEFKKIRWLSVKKVFMLTLMVVLFTSIAGFMLGAVDNLFTTALAIHCYTIRTYVRRRARRKTGCMVCG